MPRISRGLSAVALFLLAACVAVSGSARAAEGEICAPPTGPVSLMILSSGSKVHEYAASTARGVPIAAKDGSTVVFADGRVITADVDSAGKHLNELGWGARRINVVASFPKRRARPRRSYG